MVVAQRILITGGNTGIGFEAARQLLQGGHNVIITCRDAQKAHKAIDALSPVAKASGASVESALMDLASLSSVRTGAAQLLERHSRLDVLLCNAGVLSRSGSSDPLERTEDGQELTLQVNHLAHFLLVHLMLPALLASPAARVVLVSSELHRQAKAAGGEGSAAAGSGSADAASSRPVKPTATRVVAAEASDKPLPLPLASPDWLTRLSAAATGCEPPSPRPTGFQLYCISKLYNLWFTYKLAAMLPPTIKVNAVTPGWVPGTMLGRGAPWPGRLVYQYLFPLLPGTTSLAEGGRRVVAACVGSVEGAITGTYFSRGFSTESSPESRDAVAAAELWRLSEAAGGVVGGYVPPLPSSRLGAAAAATKRDTDGGPGVAREGGGGG